MQKFLIFLILIFFSYSNLMALDKEYFVMLKNNKVNVRYGPSLDYPIKFIYKKKEFPLKVIDKKENFRRIIDHKKNSGWIHISQLRQSKSLVTTSQKILFKKPTKYSKPIAKLDKGRLLIIKKCEKDWCNIKTGKFSGWVSKSDIWGNVK